MKLDEIEARARSAAAETEQRRRDAILAWQASDEEGAKLRQKTENLRALRLAKERAEAQAKAAEPPRSAVRKTARRSDPSAR